MSIFPLVRYPSRHFFVLSKQWRGDTRTLSGICTKLTMETSEWRRCSSLSIVEFGQVNAGRDVHRKSAQKV